MSASNPSCLEILARGTPLLDVRAPVEFASGAFPAAKNLPLLEDDEREKVGIAYRRSGKEAALALGHTLVSGDVKRDRVRSWLEFVGEQGQALVCCARGGLRSQIASQWLAEADRPTERVPDGFKALRHEAIGVVERAAVERDWLILGGMTGCGKTTLLRELGNALDFEAIGHHRGSSFGGFATPQPSQVSFENSLAVELLGHRHRRLLVEDEGRNLGGLTIPEPLVRRMRRSPVVVLEAPLADRVANITQSYISEPLAAGELAADLCARYQAALLRLRKRLGDRRWREHRALIDRGFATGDMEAHHRWIAGLLAAYYDPMYEYQLAKKGERIVLSGSIDQVRRHLRDRGFVTAS